MDRCGARLFPTRRDAAALFGPFLGKQKVTNHQNKKIYCSRIECKINCVNRPSKDNGTANRELALDVILNCISLLPVRVSNDDAQCLSPPGGIGPERNQT